MWLNQPQNEHKNWEPKRSDVDIVRQYHPRACQNADWRVSDAATLQDDMLDSYVIETGA